MDQERRIATLEDRLLKCQREYSCIRDQCDQIQHELANKDASVRLVSELANKDASVRLVSSKYGVS